MEERQANQQCVAKEDAGAEKVDGAAEENKVKSHLLEIFTGGFACNVMKVLWCVCCLHGEATLTTDT